MDEFVKVVNDAQAQKAAQRNKARRMKKQRTRNRLEVAICGLSSALLVLLGAADLVVGVIAYPVAVVGLCCASAMHGKFTAYGK